MQPLAFSVAAALYSDPLPPPGAHFGTYHVSLKDSERTLNNVREGER